MKKIIKISFVGLLVAMTASYGLSLSQKSDIVSDLALANVEALAAFEEGGITCSRTCSDGVGRCYRVYDRWGNCHFSGYQSDNCAC